MPKKLTPAGAYVIASQWGSYMNNSDPGMCFYCFHPDDGRPVSEDHRADVLEQIGVRLARDLSEEDREDLESLAAYLTDAPLYARAAA